jgi:hypothetical protein
MKGLWVAAGAVCIIVPYAAASEADQAWAALGLASFEPQSFVTPPEEAPSPLLVGADTPVTAPIAERELGVGSSMSVTERVVFDSGEAGEALARLGPIGVPSVAGTLGRERLSARDVLGFDAGREAHGSAMGGVIASIASAVSVR